MHPFYFTLILTIAYFQRQLLYLGDKSRESEAAAADLTEQEKPTRFSGFSLGMNVSTHRTLFCQKRCGLKDFTFHPASDISNKNWGQTCWLAQQQQDV